MLSRKICLLGAVAVGKTSLCRRFLHGVFSDKYHSTIGVKVDKCTVRVEDDDVNLIIWDLQGEERYHKIMPAFIKGMAGFFLVVDVSRPETLDVGIQIHTRVEEQLGEVPFLLILSKCDLPYDDSLLPRIRPLADKAQCVVKTSAYSDIGVSEAFTRMAEIIA